ncbi:MAG: LytTR family transcriptional regulator [Lachnospiraceae bacterium]|nr:LytTR family transcriptional regulator [Lachnospiraceae bacterium]
MKVSMEQITEGQEEIRIRYRKMTPEIRRILKFLYQSSEIPGKNEEGQYRLFPEQIYYFERVDDKIFACTKEAEYQVDWTLKEAEEKLKIYGFFRCSKSFVVNVHCIVSVKSEIGNRMDVRLDNEEHLIISRRYVKEFREFLKGESENEQNGE